jgi:hypothetical protein
MHMHRQVRCVLVERAGVAVPGSDELFKVLDDDIIQNNLELIREDTMPPLSNCWHQTSLPVPDPVVGVQLVGVARLVVGVQLVMGVARLVAPVWLPPSLALVWPPPSLAVHPPLVWPPPSLLATPITSCTPTTSLATPITSLATPITTQQIAHGKSESDCVHTNIHYNS